MDRFRVFSDLHLDYNNDFEISIPDDGVFSVCAGDISGNRRFCNIGYPDGESDIAVSVTDAAFDAIGGGTTVAKRRFSNDGRTPMLEIGGKTYGEDELGIHLDFRRRLCDGNEVSIRAVDVRGWIRDNLKNGVFVAGNHIVYNGLDKTVEELKADFASDFPLDSDVTFLDATTGVMAKDVDGTLFVGTTLYTDYRLPIGDCIRLEDIVRRNMRIATPMLGGGGMNDFVLGRVGSDHGGDAIVDDRGRRYLSPNDYLAWFNLSMGRISEIAEANADRDIVVVTHHCPSRKCIGSEYVDSELNASYVSELDGFIESHPQIRCWVCGHVHHRDTFKIGGCRVVMNPLGYCRHGQFLGHGWDWSPNVFVDTKTWDVSVEPFDDSAMKAEYERQEERRQACLRFGFPYLFS